MPIWRSLQHRAAQLAPRLEADARRLIADLQHHRQPPRRDVGQRLDVGELHAPVAGEIELAASRRDSPAPRRT